MKYTIIYCSLCLLFNLNLNAQDRLNSKTLDSLRVVSINKKQKKTSNNFNDYPPPPILKKGYSRTCFKCKKKYNIPDSVFLKTYPFNADSILIYYPDLDCDNFKDYYLLKKMTTQEIAIFTDLLYNYDYKTKAKTTLLVRSNYSFNRADLKMIFHHKDTVNEMKLFFEEKPHEQATQFWIESTFEDIDFGTSCSDSYKRFKNFFKNIYHYDIKECVEIEIEIPDLVQN